VAFYIGQAQGYRLTGGTTLVGTQLPAGCIVADGLDDAWFEGHVLEREPESMGLFPIPQALTIDKELYLVTGRYDVHGFDRSCGVVPMTDQMGAAVFHVYPSVPHDLMGIKGILGNTHRIDLATASIVLSTPVMRVRIGKNNAGTT